MNDRRLDDWASTNSRLGGVRDKSTGIFFDRRLPLSVLQLEQLYVQNSTVAKLINQPADTALSRGWSLKNVVTEDGSEIDLKLLLSKLSDLGVDEALRSALKWRDLYGGAVIFLPVRDGQELDQPLNLKRAYEVTPLRVLSAPEVIPGEMDADLLSPTYQRVLNYQLATLVGQQLEDVHHSRVISLEAVTLPTRLSLSQRMSCCYGWGPSLIERIFDELGQDGAVAKHAVAMMYISSILHIGINGYAQKHGAQGGREALERLFDDMRKNLDSLGILGLDAMDTIGNLTLSVDGAPALIDQIRARLAAAADRPKEILFNESPQGLSNGQLTGPQEIWYGQVGALQHNTLTPVIDRILEAVLPAFSRMYGLPAIESWEVEWPPLWAPSEEATANVMNVTSAADNLYLTHGVVTPDEVREFRFVKGKTGPLELEAEEPAEPLDLSVEDLDQALPSEQPASEGTKIAAELKSIIVSMNKHEITYDQAVGLVGISFPALRGREPSVLGPRQADVLPVEAEPSAEPSAQPSADAVPDDVMSVRDAAAKFGLPTRALTKQIESGSLRYWGIGAHKRVSLAEVAALARSHEASGDDEDEGDGASD